ncbi:MAG: pre-peptidase C-terminal domain-containing protein [Isosphaeraceae bacterium]|nr:pre-peptidase C-terminal domain-containing protein [Isosphaeraceae bacterium]
MPIPFRVGRTIVLVMSGWAWALGCALPCGAQTPPPPSLPDARLNWVFPAGGRQGTTFEVAVDGFDLDGAKQLLFGTPGISGVPKLTEPGLGQTGRQPVSNVFDVTIKPEVKPGVYEVRVAGKYGVSTPRAFVVGNQPEVRETEPNNAFKQATEVRLGTVINGNTKETATDYFKFSAKQGQRLIIDCWAFRIDSNLDATLVLYDAEGRELERNRNTNRRDPLIDFTVPRDGEYVVGLYDFLYGYYTLPAECFYRLSISTAPYLDYIFPPAGLPGSQGQYTLYGRNLPGAQPAPHVRVGGKPLETLTVTIPLPADKAQHLGGDRLIDPSEAFIDGIEYRLDSPQGLSNPLLVSMAGAPVVVEREPNNDPSQAMAVTPPCEVAGQFSPRGDRDWATFAAKKGDVYWIEVFSQRLGLSTDPFLLVQQVKKDATGKEQVIDLQSVDDLAETSSFVHWSLLSGLMFDTTSHDPACRFVAPEDGTYRVLVRDLARAAEASPRFVYRLLIRPPQPDFRLVAVPRTPPKLLPEQGAMYTSQGTTWAPLLRNGGRELIEVFAVRRDGFDGEIRLSADRLPAGVNAAPVVIAPVLASSKEPVKRSSTLVLTVADGATSGAAPITIKGRATIGPNEVVREVRPASMIWPTLMTGVTYSRSRLTHQLIVAVDSHESAPFSLEVRPDLVLEASPLGTVKVPVSVVRRGDFKGSVTLAAHGLPPIPSNVLHAQPPYFTSQEIKANENVTEFVLTVPYGAPTGTHSFFLSGAGNARYSRNPEALKAALDRKAAVEKIVADTAARSKSALEAQAAAEKRRLECSSARAAAKQAVDKALAEAKPALEQAAATAAAQLKDATEAKVAADKAVAETDMKAKESAAFLQAFSQEVTKLQEKAKPADLPFSAPSSSITLKITAGPVALELSGAKVQLKQGVKLELPVPIRRLYGYADPVQLSVYFAGGVAGLSAAPITIMPGQTQGTLVLEAAANAPLGTHVATVRATTPYGGQSLFVDEEIPLTIDKADPPKPR